MESVENLIEKKEKVSKTTTAVIQPVSVPKSLEQKLPSIRPFSETFTLTFGEIAENHAGMEQIGKGGRRQGFTLADFEDIKKRLPQAEIVYLDKELDAGVLIIRNGIEILTGKSPDDLFRELKALKWDMKAKMRGKVVNKHARYNLCFGKEYRGPNFEEGKGTIEVYTPTMKILRDKLPIVFGPKAEDLECEGNYYFDYRKCGIGYHGDGERGIVIGARLGATFPLRYLKFENSKIIDGPWDFNFNHGDMYVMTNKAAGTDWKRRIIPTFRHAAGRNYIDTKSIE